MSNATGDVVAQAASPPLSRRLVAVAPMAALVGFTALVAAVTFVLSFVGLRDYASSVAGVPKSIAWLVPVGVDGLTLCAVAATFVLRQAPWHVRVYAWSVFGVAILASVAGNLSHADARDLTWQGHVGAAAWPSLLALASHLVIVTWRHVERRIDDDRGALPLANAEVAPGVAPTSTPPRKRRTNGAATATPLLVVTRQRDGATPASVTTLPAIGRHAVAPATSDGLDRASLVRRVVDGELSAGDVAEQLGVSRRTIERDVAAARERQPVGATAERA